MAANNQNENNELKKRFDNFHRQARYDSKPYRLLGRPQIANRHVSVLIGYPSLENVSDRAGFAEIVSNQLKEYGLESAEIIQQKSGLRVQARILVVPAATTEKPETA
jgi:hypothetical protein